MAAHRRDQLERLIRYTGRGAVLLERLTQDANGDLVYMFTRPWLDGTTGVKLVRLERLEKLAAMPPSPMSRSNTSVRSAKSYRSPARVGNMDKYSSTTPQGKNLSTTSADPKGSAS
ncbi:MAG: transposase [bacterium]|nr:transposase [bacterium]